MALSKLDSLYIWLLYTSPSPRDYAASRKTKKNAMNVYLSLIHI